MEENDPTKRSMLRTVILPVIVATVFSGAVMLIVPEVGWFAVLSAWIGTVLFMSIWGSFYR